MDKIKEKPKGSSAVREKGKDLPRRAVRRGLENGADRLRVQLRDTAQWGQRDEYGGDQVEDAAARVPGQMVRAAEGLVRSRKRPDRTTEGPGYVETEMPGEPPLRDITVAGNGRGGRSPATGQGAGAPVTARSVIKTREAVARMGDSQPPHAGPAGPAKPRHTPNT